MDKDIALTKALAYTEEVCKILNPQMIILYGSYAEGTATADSDIDIAIIFNNYNGDWLQDSKMLWKLTRKISTNIEPILLDRTKDPSGFVDRICTFGETLYTEKSSCQ